MAEENHLDDLVTLLREKRAELRTLGQKISESARDTTVVFVDLCGSTAIKSQVPAEEWLGYVFEFIQSVARHAEAEAGIVVKRIGDEVMLTFREPAASERFIDRLIADEDMHRYRFKIAADAGEVFHFQFVPQLTPDPYGQVVDRCARIAKLAGPGVVVCSDAYRKRLETPANYAEVGEFPLKGFQNLEKVFWRPVVPDADASFAEPLLRALNEPGDRFVGYRVTSRLVSAGDLRRFPEGHRAARPFLIRELLNVPKLPMSPEEVEQALRLSKDPDRVTWYVGYVVEWSGMFELFKRDDDGIDVRLRLATSIWDRVDLRLAVENLEIVRRLKPGDHVFFRGVITRISFGFELNYVELLRVEPGAA